MVIQVDKVSSRVRPRSQGDMPQQSSRFMAPAPVASLPAQPTRGGGQAARGGGQLARGHPRGGGQSGKAQPHFYAFLARPEIESSDAVLTGIVPVCHRDASILFDLGSIYSYMSSYFASYMVMPRDSLSAHVYMSMSVGDSIIVYHVYRSCVVSIGSLETSVDLLRLDMADFDVILGMDWMLPYHAILDYHAKTARRMVKKGCLAYLAYIRDPSTEVPSMDLVLVVYEFPEVFPIDLTGMPPDRDIDFCIDLALSTQPISILPYRMATPELKDRRSNCRICLIKIH
ncbi:uncharacterized protein [Nicotiana tomentosiformis]|uniref:uncharacterized protein n=1 Tax=Nicotiana tomentosiformis TaxID=4098 RepID=UPI00388CBCC9